MKRFKKVFMALAFIFAGVLAFSLASNTKVHAEGTTVTYTVASTSSVTVSGTAPTGTTATYASTYGTVEQLTKNNSMTLTLSGFEGNKITGLSLSMKSNSKGGSGNLTVTAGTTTIASKETAAFNTETWNGAWATSYVDVAVTMTKDDYVIEKDENVVITIAATANSLYCQSFTLTYETVSIVELNSISLNKTSLELQVGDEDTLSATLDPATPTYPKYTWVTGDDKVATVDESGKVTAVGVGETTISAVSNHDNTIKGVCDVTVTAATHPELVQFRGLDLQEQLVFNYKYDNEWLPQSTIVNNGKYYIGYVSKEKVSLLEAETTKGFSATNSFSGALEFTFVSTSTSGYFAIMEDSKYLSNANTVNVVRNDTLDESNEEFLWSLDAESGKIINKSSSRFLGFVDNTYGEVRAYNSTQYPIATIIPANGNVTLKDAANNADRVTMRIGYEISKTLYESLEESGDTVTFGVRLNDTTNVECTKAVVDENTYRLFVAVNNIPLDKIDTVITACGYVSVDGVDTYTTEVNTYSVRSLAEYYLTNKAEDAAVIAANYPLYYLAYYA